MLAAVLQGLDTASAQSATFFYADSRYGDTAFDAAYEARQIALFRADAPALTAARLALAGAVGQVIRNGLAVMGVEAADELH